MNTNILSIREKMILADNLEYRIQEFIWHIVLVYTAKSKRYAKSYYANSGFDLSKCKITHNALEKTESRNFLITIENENKDYYIFLVPLSILEMSNVDPIKEWKDELEKTINIEDYTLGFSDKLEDTSRSTI